VTKIKNRGHDERRDWSDDCKEQDGVGHLCALTFAFCRAACAA
jgi:hypothetical protein